MTSSTFCVLTVCIGNVCRSPVAERLLRLHLGEHLRAGRLAVDSAGVGAMVGDGVQPLARTELERLGGTGEGFAARQIDSRHVAHSDLVLAATVEVRTKTLRQEPRAMKRAFTLPEFAAVCAASWDTELVSPEDLVAYAAAHRTLASGTDLDVADPMGRNASVHREVADQIDRHVRVIAGRLGPLLSGVPAP